MGEEGLGEVAPREVDQKAEIPERGEIILNALESRRSYRQFTEQSVPQELIERIIDCALKAPSAKNAQPWRLHVVRQGEALQKIADIFSGDTDALNSRPIDPQTGQPNETVAATVAESLEVIRHAPVTIFIENMSPLMGGRENVLNSQFRDQAIHGLNGEMMGIGAAVANLYTATEAVGLGGVFMGDIIVGEPQIKAKLGMQGDLVGVFALGHPVQAREQLWPKPEAPRESRVVYHE